MRSFSLVTEGLIYWALPEREFYSLGDRIFAGELIKNFLSSVYQTVHCGLINFQNA